MKTLLVCFVLFSALLGCSVPGMDEPIGSDIGDYIGQDTNSHGDTATTPKDTDTNECSPGETAKCSCKKGTYGSKKCLPPGKWQVCKCKGKSKDTDVGIEPVDTEIGVDTGTGDDPIDTGTGEEPTDTDTYTVTIPETDTGTEYMDTDTYTVTIPETDTGTELTESPMNIEIPDGEFFIGQSDDPTLDNYPAKKISIVRFWVMRKELTVEMYDRCVEANVCEPVNVEYDCDPNSGNNNSYRDNPQLPVNCINWYQSRTVCEFYCGRHVNESEWEYIASNIGQEDEYPWGNDDPDPSLAVYKDSNSKSQEICFHIEGNTDQDVCDMSGNLSEWVRDVYNPGYFSIPTNGACWEPDDAHDQDSWVHVVRGGSYLSTKDYIRANHRSSASTFTASPEIGVRCAFGNNVDYSSPCLPAKPKEISNY